MAGQKSQGTPEEARQLYDELVQGEVVDHESLLLRLGPDGLAEAVGSRKAHELLDKAQAGCLEGFSSKERR